MNFTTVWISILEKLLKEKLHQTWRGLFHSILSLWVEIGFLSFWEGNPGLYACAALVHFRLVIRIMVLFYTDVTIASQLLFIWTSKETKICRDSAGSRLPAVSSVVWERVLICSRYKTICRVAGLPKINETINYYIFWAAVNGLG